MRIIHVTPHLGGGVGNLIHQLVSLDGKNKHRVLMLEEPVQFKYVNLIKEESVEVMFASMNAIKSELFVDCDIVIIHWWHHPKTTEMMHWLSNIPLRVIIWSHISNLTVPSLNPQIIELANHTVFATDASYNATGINSLSGKTLSEKTSVIYSCAKFDTFERTLKKNDNFVIGYLGYVDYSKMYKSYIKAHEFINTEEMSLLMVGDCPIEKLLRDEVSRYGLSAKVEITGHVSNVNEQLSRMDVFGYLLNSFHTGSTEIAVLEAMNAGVVPIMFNQLVEKYLVSDYFNGLLVHNEMEYKNAVRYLYRNPKLKEKMSYNARVSIAEKYTQQKMMNSFYKVIDYVGSEKKEMKLFSGIIGHKPEEWFISSLGKNRVIFENIYFKKRALSSDDLKKISMLLTQKNKSSVHQYARNFPDAKELNQWSQDIIDKKGTQF